MRRARQSARVYLKLLIALMIVCAGCEEDAAPGVTAEPEQPKRPRGRPPAARADEASSGSGNAAGSAASPGDDATESEDDDDDEDHVQKDAHSGDSARKGAVQANAQPSRTNRRM